MKSRQRVNQILLNVHPHIRYRWCENDICACKGCVNFSGVSKEEWRRWLEETNNIRISHNNQTVKKTEMEWIKDHLILEALKWFQIEKTEIYQKAVGELIGLGYLCKDELQ